MCKKNKEQGERKLQGKIDVFNLPPWFVIHKSAGKCRCYKSRNKKYYMCTGKFMRHPASSGILLLTSEEQNNSLWL